MGEPEEAERGVVSPDHLDAQTPSIELCVVGVRYDCDVGGKRGKEVNCRAATGNLRLGHGQLTVRKWERK